MKRMLAALAAAAVVSPHAQAMPVSANVAVTVDDAGGRAVDAGISISPGEHVTLSAGAGHSTASDETADLQGTLLNAGISLHGDRGGFSLDYDAFDDSTNYRTGTFAGRGWFSAGDFEIALLARRRDLDVTLTLDLPLRTIEREVSFSALGAGLQLSFVRGDWSAYVQGLTYDYDDDFDDFMALTRSPQLAQRPRIEALVGSFLTQAQGAIDRQYGAGVERTFGRHSLAVDLSRVHDAILDSSSSSLAVTYSFAQSARFDWSLMGGLVDSDSFGGIGFVGISLGVMN